MRVLFWAATLAFARLTRAQVTIVLSPQSVVTVAGSGVPGFNDGDATSAGFNLPQAITIDSKGVLFVADYTNHKIRAVFPNRSVTTFAGGGASGVTSGSANGVGTNATFYGPTGIAISATDINFIGDAANHKIRFILPNATVGTLAGGGATGFLSGSADGVGTAALFFFPIGVAVDASNVVYVVDSRNHKIRRIAAFTAWSDPSTATVTTLAGGGAGGTLAGFVNGVGTNALFSYPYGITVASTGICFVADKINNRIRAIAPDGTVSTLAGGGNMIGQDWGSTDAAGTAALFNNPIGLAIDTLGMLYVSDYVNHKVRKIFPNATVVTIAGGGVTGNASGLSNGVGTAALFNYPFGIVASSTNGVVYVADSYNYNIRAIFPIACEPGEYITDDAISAAACAPCPQGSYSTEAGYRGCSLCAAGTFSAQMSSTSCLPCPIGRFTPSPGSASCLQNPATPQSVVTVAGGGATGTLAGSQDGDGTSAGFRYPCGIAVSSAGVLLVTDSLNHNIKAIFPNRSVITLAGGSTAGAANGVGTSALFNGPSGIAVSALNVVYIADSSNNLVRFMLSSASVGTLAGGGATGLLSGSADGVGTSALFFTPYAVAVDASNTVFVSDKNNHKIRRIAAFTAWSSPSTAAVTTLAGGSSAGLVDGMGSNALFYYPLGIVIGSSGTLFIADSFNHKIRTIAPDGAVTTLAGGGGASGRTLGSIDAAGTAALFNNPIGLAIDTQGVLYVGDYVNNKVRKIFPNATVVTIAGGSATGNASGVVNGVGTAALFYLPCGIASTSGVVHVTEINPGKIRAIFPFACAPGQFITDDLPVGGCAPCPGGSYATFADYLCTLCPIGTYCPLSSITPTPCPAGTYSSAVGASSNAACTRCTVGTYSESDGATSSSTCSPCLAGTFGAVSGASSASLCVQCPLGNFSVQGAADCPYTSTTCPIGTFANATTSACLPCYPATACAVAGLTAQPPCYWNVSTLAGSGVAGWADGQGPLAQFSDPHGVTVEPVSLSLYIADYNGQRVRKISPSGLVTTLAGSGAGSFADGFGTSASFNGLLGISFHVDGNAFVADYYNHRIRKILPSGMVSTFAGSGTAGGTNGIGTNAMFSGPSDIVFDSTSTTVYITEQGSHRIRSIVVATATVSTLAGSSVAGFADNVGTNAKFDSPTSAAWHPSGVLYIADGFGANNRIRRIVISTTAVTTFAGNGAAGGSDGIGTSATFALPRGVALDSSFSVLYVAEQGGQRIRSIQLSTAIVTTIAGSGIASYRDDFGISAAFNGPIFITGSASGILYTSDNGNRRIRQLTCVPCPASFYCSSGAPVICPATFYCPFATVNPIPCPCGGCTTTGAAIAPSCTTTSTISPTSSPSPTLSPTLSPTPTTTKPPFSCLFRGDGCSSPSLSYSAPTLPSGAVLPGASDTVVASWPWLKTPIFVTLPSLPSPTETLTVKCSSSSSALSVISAPGNAACSTSAVGSACATADASMKLPLQFIVVGAPPDTVAALNSTLSTASTVTCTVASRAIETAGAEYPKYGLSTTLSLSAIALPSSWPLIAGIFKESRAVPGDFSAAAGLGTTAKSIFKQSLTLSASSFSTSPSCSDVFTANSSSVSWSSPTLPLCAPAQTAIASLVTSARSIGSTPSLSVSVFGATHFIIVAAAGTIFPRTFNATLGGAPCVVNWVALDGSLASITTPTLASLCTALGAPSGASDCGTAQLVLSGALSPFTAALASLPVTLPITYGSFLVGDDFEGAVRAAAADATFAREGILSLRSRFGELIPLINGDADSFIAAAELVPPGVGFRAMAECKDFSPTALCAAAAALSYDPPVNLTCAWGSGDSCSACPEGALCPGGTVLLAVPGFWTPLSAASPPADLKPCPQPDATIRCPGWRNVTFSGASSAMGCGRGYRGVACAACAKGFFPTSGICDACPSLGADKLLAAATPILVFIAGLVGVGAALTIFVHSLGASWFVAALAAGSLSAWFFTAAQSAAAAFTVTQSVSPPELASWYIILTSLLFKGVSLPPACYESIPFLDAWVAVVVGVVLLLVGAVSTTCIVCGRRTKGLVSSAEAGAPPPPSSAHRLLRLTSSIILLGFGPMTAAFSNALTCSSTALQPVRVYLTLTHDGTTLASALASSTSAVSRALAASGATSTTVADFERAFSDPVFSTTRRLKSALDAPLSFALVLSDSFSVCYEGVHASAWLASAVVGGFVIVGFPLLGIWARSPYDRAVPCASRASWSSLRVLHETLSSVLEDTSLRQNAALFPFALLMLSTVLIGTTSLASRETNSRTFVGLLCLGVTAPLVFAVATLRFAPYTGRARWQSSGTAALLILSSISSTCSIFLFFSRQDSATSRWAAYVPLVSAAPLPFWIFGMWWRALSREFAVAKVAEAPPAVFAADESDEEVINPLHVYEADVHHAPQPPADAARDVPELVETVDAPSEELSPTPPPQVAEAPTETTIAALVLPADAEYIFPSQKRAGAISAMDFLPEHHRGPLFDSHRSALLLGARLVKGREAPGPSAVT